MHTHADDVISVCGDDIDHCVQAVGVNTATGGWWKVRNSWGVNWGEQGYIRLARCCPQIIVLSHSFCWLLCVGIICIRDIALYHFSGQLGN